MKKTIALLLAVIMALAMAACAQKEQPPPAKVDGPRMVQVGGELYIDTGERITLLRCGVMDGEITETVGPNEVPDCSYAEEMSALGLAMAADPMAASTRSGPFHCNGEEPAADVETAIGLALRETDGDCDAADAAFDTAADLWRVHLTGEDGETTVWLGTDGVTRQVVDQPAKPVTDSDGEGNEPPQGK